MKHTPGPWRAFRQESGRVVIETEAWKPIATIVMRKSDVTDCEANANLIALSPQLLEGIRKARAVAASPQSFDLEEVERDFAALIAKAEQSDLNKFSGAACT